jgi:hypothetical protein
MPTISMFFGIIVRMYFAPKEHNPPHIHVYYQDDSAVVDIENGELESGKIGKKQLKLVSAWIEIHKESLLANCDLCQKGEKPFTITPLN